MGRTELPSRRRHITQKARIGPQRVLYLSVDDEQTPHELFLRIKGESGAEKVCCYDVIARLVSLALQEGVPLERIAERLRGTRSEPAGPVQGDALIKFCDGTMDYIGRHLLVYYCGRTDLAHGGQATL
jgi:ribonucleoside-diphosphate reductase alpha chain